MGRLKVGRVGWKARRGWLARLVRLAWLVRGECGGVAGVACVGWWLVWLVWAGVAAWLVCGGWWLVGWVYGGVWWVWLVRLVWLGWLVRRVWLRGWWGGWGWWGWSAWCGEYSVWRIATEPNRNSGILAIHLPLNPAYVSISIEHDRTTRLQHEDFRVANVKCFQVNI